MKFKNPVVDGWYADPESRVYGDSLYVYVTRSAQYGAQLNMDAFVSRDFKTFEKLEGILDMPTYKGAARALWAPTVVEKEGRYYIIFAANDIHEDDAEGGLFIGVCDTPEGPFKNVFEDGRPLLNKFYNGAQPIDAHLFKDDDGRILLYYGGWGHLNGLIMNDQMNGFVPHEDGSVFKEITPKGYVEAPCMLKKDGYYYLMWSSGGWGDGSYCVHYSRSEKPFENIEDRGVVLVKSAIADGPGHNGYFQKDGKYYITYHRRIIGDDIAHHRVLCIDELKFDNGNILPVIMT